MKATALPEHAFIPVDAGNVSPCQSDVYAFDWYVIHTNPRCEGRAANGLRARGLQVYAPQEVVWKMIRKGRGKTRIRAKRPAYPRYLFVGMQTLSWEIIHTCDGVAGIVCMDHAPVRIRAKEIEALQIAEDMGVFDHAVEPKAITVGGKVMLTYGPFDGYSATVKAIDGRNDDAKRLTIEVDILGKATPMEIPIDMIRLLA
ncbi:transcription termination/antitermination protein NusG [Pleomorphomonas oryzae]|uniref:transcription termination/antitermination protein NusG n=1 Tax=Pleomorphomonas oryzae TaxID=261934 RepID=UPI00047C7819|nr:transcription termination/antitermination NusG family protein [Pleomorphomonas oryzae]